MTKTEQQQLWAERIEAYQRSEQKVSEWCNANNLMPYQLRYWLKKNRTQPATTIRTTQWLPIEIRGNEETLMEPSLLIKVGQASVEVKRGFDAKLLLEIVQNLSRLC